MMQLFILTHASTAKTVFLEAAATLQTDCNSNSNLQHAHIRSLIWLKLTFSFHLRFLLAWPVFLGLPISCVNTSHNDGKSRALSQERKEVRFYC